MKTNRLTITMTVTEKDNLHLYDIERIAKLTKCKFFKSVSNITDRSTKIVMVFESSCDIDYFKEILDWYKAYREHYCG